MAYLISGYTGGTYIGVEYVGGEIIEQETADTEPRAYATAEHIADRDGVEHVTVDKIEIAED